MKKLKPKQVLTRCYILLGIGALLWLGASYNENKVLAAIALIPVVGTLIFHLVFYRCPHCDSYLYRSRGEFCPHCGKKVNE